jgi:hypothetical protein
MKMLTIKANAITIHVLVKSDEGPDTIHVHYFKGDCKLVPSVTVITVECNDNALVHFKPEDIIYLASTGLPMYAVITRLKQTCTIYP